ncbi:MAG TPA: hypothetical protein VHK06_03290, partial [Candidatus Limnocylindria bacterium]|nr:hypothetical protein [Candidatus Limnocylindria bacterium]
MADIDLNEFIGPLVAPSTQVPSRDRAPAADRMELWRQTTDGIWFSWRTDGGGWTSEASAPPELTDEDPADRLW